jgi:hypothetical protein
MRQRYERCRADRNQRVGPQSGWVLPPLPLKADHKPKYQRDADIQNESPITQHRLLSKQPTSVSFIMQTSKKLVQESIELQFEYQRVLPARLFFATDIENPSMIVENRS